jgi:hypothetical protein
MALVATSCAGARLPDPGPPSAQASAPGYRALFRGEAEGRTGKGRFRLAVAILPPDRIRLEFFGPVGGPRAIVAASAGQAIALLPSARAYEKTPSSAEGIDRMLGLPVDVAGLVALLTGRPMCPQESARVEVMSRPAATFGRTLSWYQVSCPPDDVRYEARCEDRGGTLLTATVSEAITGAIILQADYGDYQKGLGQRWPRQVRLRLLKKEATVQLAAVEGPWGSDVPESIFTPDIPEGFESRRIDLFPDGPGLPGGDAGLLR